MQFFFLKFQKAKLLSDKNAQLISKVAIDNLPEISIVICAKNAAHFLQKNLSSILEQDYPKDIWELILVNDGSTDNTIEIIKEFQKKHSQLRTINIDTIDKPLPGKKFALDCGIKAAKYSWILLTDADCQAVSNQWLHSFGITQLKNNKEIILGYGSYQRQKGFLNLLIQWETLQTCIQYSGMTLQNLPYMGVGRNLFYKKSLYYQAFEKDDFQNKYSSLASGDDDLLIATIANAANTDLCLIREAHTISTSPSRYKEWLSQKKRHLSTGKYYNRQTQSVLALAAFSKGLFWLLWLLLIPIYFGLFLNTREDITNTLIAFALLTGIIRILLYWHSTTKWYQILNAQKLVLSIPFSEICLSVFYLIISPYIFWKNKKGWK